MKRLPLPLVFMSLASLLASGCVSPFYMGQQPSTKHRDVGPRIPAGPVAAIRTVAVVPSGDKPLLDIQGDYGWAGPDPGEAAAQTARDVSREMGEELASGLVDDPLFMEDPTVLLLAPIVVPLAAIGAAATTRVQQQIQVMRDAVTTGVSESIDHVDPNNDLAAVLQERMDRIPNIDSTLVAAGEVDPPGGDATLHVRVSSILVQVDGGNATLSTRATAALTQRSAPAPVFRNDYTYKVTEDLDRWARNDYELLRDYEQGARQYLARQISDEFFNVIQLRHVLRPVDSGSGTTLGWELILLGENPPHDWANAISEVDATYDLEIFDGSNLLFSAHDIEESRLEVPDDLPPCTMLRWTVRPVYRFDGIARVGEWLAHESATRRMYAANRDAGVMEYLANEQLSIRELTEGYPQFKTRCRR